MAARHDIAAVPEPEHPWERMTVETERQFEGFAQYRDQKPPRSLAAVGVALGIGPTMPRDWSASFGWRARAAAYDAMLDRERVVTRVREVRDMERRHAQLAAAGLSALTMPIAALGRPRQHPAGQIPRMAELEALPTDELVRLAARSANALSRLVGVERLSRGEATTIVTGQVDVAVDTPLPDEQRLRAIFAAMEEAGLSATVEVGPTLTLDSTEEP